MFAKLPKPMTAIVVFLILAFTGSTLAQTGNNQVPACKLTRTLQVEPEQVCRWFTLFNNDYYLSGAPHYKGIMIAESTSMLESGPNRFFRTHWLPGTKVLPAMSIYKAGTLIQIPAGVYYQYRMYDYPKFKIQHDPMTFQAGYYIGIKTINIGPDTAIWDSKDVAFEIRGPVPGDKTQYIAEVKAKPGEIYLIVSLHQDVPFTERGCIKQSSPPGNFTGKVKYHTWGQPIFVIRGGVATTEKCGTK